MEFPLVKNSCQKNGDAIFNGVKWCDLRTSEGLKLSRRVYTTVYWM